MWISITRERPRRALILSYGRGKCFRDLLSRVATVIDNTVYILKLPKAGCGSICLPSWQLAGRETGGSGIQSQPRLHSQPGLYEIPSCCVVVGDPQHAHAHGFCSPGLWASQSSSRPLAVGSLLSSMHGSSSSSCKRVRRDTQPVQRSVPLS